MPLALADRLPMSRRRKTGRRVDRTGRSVGVDRFLGLPHYLLKSAAWKSLAPTPRALFVEVAQRWNGFNNGSIGLGVREAGHALHIKHTTAGAAFKVLQDRGLLALMRDSGFDQKRLAREWRVTAFVVGDYRAPTRSPTNDFLRWQAPIRKQKAGPIGDPRRTEREPDTGATESRKGPMAVSGPTSIGPIGDSHLYLPRDAR